MSTSPLPQPRADLQGFGGYRSARTESVQGDVWLNANEAAWANPADEEDLARRYPEPQPAALRAAMANVYGVQQEQLLIGRGSDECIDLLVRAYCTPGEDAVVTTPPVFGMYAVSTRLQGARLIEVPLQDGPDDFNADLAQVSQRAQEAGAKLVFLSSPGNPAGGVLKREGVLALARDLAGRALVVVDEAYLEFSSSASLAADVAGQRNLAVLRTLSKAHALAAARIGCVMADPEVIALLARCQAPYPIPAPCAELALRALNPAALRTTHERVRQVISERARVAQQLAALPGVRRVYPSQANFLLVRFEEPGPAFAALLEAGVVVRDQRAVPQLQDALRISIGTPEENDQLLRVLAKTAQGRAA